MKKKIIVTVIILILTIIVTSVILLKKNHGKKDDVILTEENHTSDNTAEYAGYIKIAAVDASYHVGTEFKLNIVSAGGEFSDAVVWKSSDESIVMVSSDGYVRVVGEGMAFVTATSGIYSDSLIIKGVSAEEPTETFEAETEEYTEKTTGVQTEKPTETQIERPTEIQTERPTETQTEKPTEIQTERPTEIQTERPTEAQTERPTEAQTEKPDYKSKIAAVTGEAGYTLRQDNVYIYGEDGNYLGQAIIEDDSLLIHVQTRTTGHDYAVKELLKVIIPGEYDSVFEKFIHAENNTAVMSEGHLVYIRPAVAAEQGSHAQLIIFY